MTCLTSLDPSERTAYLWRSMNEPARLRLGGFRDVVEEMSELKGNTEVRMGSERGFGIVFAVVFSLIGLFPLLGDGGVRLWALGIAAAFLSAGFLYPRALRPLNKLWFRFGLLLHRIVSPVVMGILFFLTVTPTGLIRRLFKPDPLNQRIDPDAETYWVPVDREQAAQTSMRRQF